MDWSTVMWVALWVILWGTAGLVLHAYDVTHPTLKYGEREVMPAWQAVAFMIPFGWFAAVILACRGLVLGFEWVFNRTVVSLMESASRRLQRVVVRILPPKEEDVYCPQRTKDDAEVDIDTEDALDNDVG